MRPPTYHGVMLCDGIGPAEAKEVIRRIVVLAEPDRQALMKACAAQCPPGKDKRLDPTYQRWSTTVSGGAR